MRRLRQRLGVLALVALSGHVGTLAFSVVALGCQTVRVAATVKDECCPSGSHPGVMCPMGSKKGRTAHAEADRGADRECRLVCANRDSEGLLLVAGTIPPEPQCFVASLTAEPVQTAAPDSLLQRSIVPPSPPPRV
jgi:hypothetical protein